MLQRSNRPIVACAAALLPAFLPALLVAILASCGDGARPGSTASPAVEDAPARPLLVCTTPMVGDVVRSVAGDHAEVEVLIAPGVDPHLWTPTRTDVLRILEADAVFLNGLTLEGRIGDSISRVENQRRPVLRVAQSIDRAELITDAQRAAYFDPHIWMDPSIWGRTATSVAELLAKIMPEHKADFDANAARYIERAMAVDADCARMLGTIPPQLRELISAHDAFHYFGRRFDLRVRAIQGLSTESEASISDIEDLVANIASRKIPMAFIETTVSDRTVRALVEGCASIGHDLRIGPPLYSDSLGPAGTPEGTWEGMLRHNARVIAESLGGLK